MTIKIAMWSGPRNLSTAMMYAFAARGDCTVTDEPFYAAYLALSGLPHPMQTEILARHETDPSKISLTHEQPTPLWYQKHMFHHMLPEMPTAWMAECRHAILIRHPARVIASYARKRESPTLDDLGMVQQLQMFDTIRRVTGSPPPVVDSTDIRANPGPMLAALCAALAIPFTPKMLTWPVGPKPYDGAWAPVWYGAVHQSSGFDAAEGPLPDLSAAHQALAEAAMPAYDALAARKLTP
ncbi:HAD family hydrolase [Pararhodobacter sp.]|uniref:sulfotransferase-like domain-containing protein n=1 Tax=Pararhodobacter sp. TaxID=2127056 RepID=UPI002AFF2A05|nr:HAD family hydrolase [Pararhodobacter sp.]